MKLTLSRGKLNTNFRKFNFLGKVAVKFRNLQVSKILNTDKNRLLQYLSRLCTYLWGIHCLKNNSAVSRSDCLYGVNQKYSQAKAFSFLIKSITRSFVLNTMIDNENKRFTNISISFLILFIMKLIAQINILFFLKWKYLSEIYK